MKKYDNHVIRITRRPSARSSLCTTTYEETLCSDDNDLVRFHARIYHAHPACLRIVNFYLDPVIRNRTNVITLLNHVYEHLYEYAPVSNLRPQYLEIEIPCNSWYHKFLKNAGYIQKPVVPACLDLNDDSIIMIKNNRPL